MNTQNTLLVAATALSWFVMGVVLAYSAASSCGAPTASSAPSRPAPPVEDRSYWGWYTYGSPPGHPEVECFRPRNTSLAAFVCVPTASVTSPDDIDD